MHLRTVVTGALASLVIATAMSLGAASVGPAPSVREASAPPDRVIVEFRTDNGTASERSLPATAEETLRRFRNDVARLGNASGRTRPSIRREFRTVFFGAAIDASPETQRAIRKLPYVAAIHPDREVRKIVRGTATGSSDLVDARTKVNAIGLGTDGAGIKVAVIDTGIDYTHPALGGGFGPGFKVSGGYDFVNDDEDPIDDEGHGTHVAGTIAASASDIVGVAPGATLIAYKVLSSEGTGLTSDIIAAIERGVDPDGDGDTSDHLHVMNLSLGGPGDANDPASRAVDAASAAGVVMVVAAGNDGRTASIGSPGTAEQAITVAATDDEGTITSFSSRGPSPTLLGFKPDVSAPGADITSTAIGGGQLVLSGTSMATPHVAGVAALLRALHPDWDPATVKAAITGGAVRIADQPFARGTGRVDALASTARTLFADRSGVSFGIRASRSGTSSEERTVRLTNRGGEAQSLTLAPDTSRAGISITVTPASLTIPAGESRDVRIRLDTANASLDFPPHAIVGGDVLVSGSSTMVIPWGILRTARATVRFDGIATTVLAIDRDGGRGESLRSPSVSEIFLPPGRSWDFLVIGYDIPAGEDAPLDVRRMIVRHDVRVEDDAIIDVRAADATHEIVMDARDQRGIPLRTRTGESRHRTVGIKLYRQEDGSTFSASFVGDAAAVRRIFVSPMATRYSLYMFEQLVDEETYEVYTVEYDVLRGVASSTTLSPGGALLRRAKVRWGGVSENETRLDVCLLDATRAGAVTGSFTTCTPTATRGRSAIDLFLTEERSSLAHIGSIFRIGKITTQALRGIDGRIIAATELTPSPVAASFTSGSDVELSAGPAYPFAFEGTRTGFWFTGLAPGFFGGAGEQIDEHAGTRWELFDSSGSPAGSGTWSGPGSPPIPAPQPGMRLLATRDDLISNHQVSRGALEVRFAQSGTDLTAPTLTSLRVIDSVGRARGEVSAGQSTSLNFSVADIDFVRGATTNPTRPEATKAWYRVHGSSAWNAVTVVVTGAETGAATALRHIPAGDIYRADITSSAVEPDRWIDLRLEFRDLAGNIVSWTQENAFRVGPSPAVPRTRPTRR